MCVCLTSAGAARAKVSDDATLPAAASEKSKIQPVAERQLGQQARPTVKKKQGAEAKQARSEQISLQIPKRLRKALAKKIDRRISANIKQSKKLRGEAVRLLKGFVREAPEASHEVPEALMRLGELEWEQARDDFLKEFRRWEKRPSGERGPPPVADYSKPRSRFLRVLKRYKTYRDYDLALYTDGFLASIEGKFDEALSRFNRILQWFPNSRFVADAHMMRAEHEFTKDFPNYEVAYQEYEEVLQFKDSELYDLAMFKSAWTLWRLGRTKEAARRFLTVFKQTAEAETTRDGRRRSELDELQAEALRNLVTVFAEDEKNRAEDMHRFLVQAGGEQFAGKIVRALAESFYDQAHYERGVEAYRLLLKIKPTSPDAYKWALSIAQGYSTMEEWAELERAYAWILKDFVAPAKSAGQSKKSNKSKKSKKQKHSRRSAWVLAQSERTLSRASRATEKQLRADAVGLHAKAQADKSSKSEYEAAAKLYKVYLERFANSRHAYDMHFNLAEISFYHLEDALTAADNYMAAVRLQPSGKVSKDALYNALAALEVARSDEFEQSRKQGKKPKESPTDRKLTEAMELYVTTYPNDKKVPELLFRQGKLYYDYEVYDPAVRQWGLLLEKYPNSEYSAGAGELILDSFNKSEDYDNIETWARRLKTAPSFQTEVQQKRLNTLIIGAVFKLGEQLGNKGDHDQAAFAYLRAATEFPTEPRAAQAAVNAGVEARRAGDIETLVAATQLLIDNHRQRPEAAQGLWIAANTHQEVGLFSEAAQYDDVIADNWPKFEHHKEACYNATLLRTTVGEHDLAIASGKKFKRFYARDPLADEVTFLMGKAHEKAEKWNDAAQLYARYAKSAKDPSHQIEAYVRLATVRKDNDKAAGKALEEAMRIYRRSKSRLNETGKYFAAKARYMQGERVLKQYEAVQIQGSVKQLKQRLKKKSALLKKAADAFLAAAEMGVAEWTTASLYQIGFTYESFAQALLNSPPPDNLSPQEQELYAQAIDEFVIPIEESGIEAYESGWLKAIELGIFNSWTAKMRAALGRLNSEMYPPLKEIGFELRSKGPLPLPPLITEPRRASGGGSELYLMAAGEDKAEATSAEEPAGEEKESSSAPDEAAAKENKP